MDLKVVLLVVFLSALAITSTHAAIPRCCIRTRKLGTKMLSKVERWEQQDSNICDIDALILYFKGKTRPVCADVGLVKYMKRIHKMNQQQTKRI